MISVNCPHCQEIYNLTDDYLGSKVLCAKCKGKFIISNSVEEPPQSADSITQDDLNWHQLKSSAEEKLRTTFGFEKIEGFSFSKFMRKLFSKHSWEDTEEYLCYGSPSQIPDISTVAPLWPAPWLFFRLILITVLAVIFLYWKMDFFGNNFIFMPLLIFGVIGIPFASLIFFWEVNIPQNVSLLSLIRIMLISGFLSIAITLFIHKFLGNQENPIWAGPIEETAKALAMLFFLKNKKYCYKLNGLLIGAAVGAGFAVIETGGYVMNAEEEFNFVMIGRALCSPFGHIAYSALVGAGLWRVAKNVKWDVANLLNRKFLSLFSCAIAIHMFWNSSLLKSEFILKIAIVAIIEYTLVAYLIQEGINEIRHIKISKEKQITK